MASLVSWVSVVWRIKIDWKIMDKILQKFFNIDSKELINLNSLVVLYLFTNKYTDF